MQRKKHPIFNKSMFRKLALMLCLAIFMGAAVPPATVQAGSSWINREESGIYPSGEGNSDLGQGMGDFDEEDNAQEDESDEGTKWYANLFGGLFKSILNAIARALFGIMEMLGASLDHLVYGRLVTNKVLFTFDLGKGNIYGIVGSAIYRVLAGVMLVMMIAVLVVKVIIGAWKKGGVAQNGVTDALWTFGLGALLLMLMPNFLDVALYIRDNLLYLIGTEGATALFGAGNSTSLISTLAASANENIVSSIMYIAAVLLNLYFILGYVGVALTMTVDYIMFPFVVLKFSYDRQSLKDWVWEMVSCMLVPVIDAILIMIPSFLGIYAVQGNILNSMAVTVIQVIICYFIIPVRNYARQILGMRTSPFESTGLAAAGIIGKFGADKIKKNAEEKRETKKNAEADRERANMEEDQAALEEEERKRAEIEQQKAGKGVATADEMYDRFTTASGNDEDAEQEEEPLGRPQTYADGLESHIKSKEADSELAQALNRNEEETAQTRQALAEYEEGLRDLETNDSISEEERSELRDDYTAGHAAAMARLERLQAEREALEPDPELNDKIREANKKLEDLRDERDEIDRDPTLSDADKRRELDRIDDEMQETEKELQNLIKQKEFAQIQQEKADLAKEPAALRKELEGLAKENEELSTERENLVRQRSKLEAEQDNLDASGAEYWKKQNAINRLDEQIAGVDQKLADNLQKQKSASGALEKQQTELRDRQAYNLHERVKAQTDYDNAKQEAQRLQKRLDEGVPAPLQKRTEDQLARAQKKMETSKARLGELSTEDRRLSSRLEEISPDLGKPTVAQLQAAKMQQNVKRADLQRQIASLQAKGEADGDTTKYKAEVARLQSEVAECNYQSARIDQMMSSAVPSPAGVQGGGRGTAPGAVASEYDAKRAALLERYANVDNFDSPEFASISHARKAQLYRERAMQTEKVYARKKAGRVIGAVAGGTMGMWLGSAGVIPGAMIGEAVGGNIGMNSAMRYAQRHSFKPADYANNPSQFKVSSDFRDNTQSGQRDTVVRVQASLQRSLDEGTFTELLQSEMADHNRIKTEVKAIFKKHGVNEENYEVKRPQMVADVRKAVMGSFYDMENSIVEKCAGDEYAKLSAGKKKKILERVVLPNDRVITSTVEQLYLRENWEPGYGEYLDD